MQAWRGIDSETRTEWAKRRHDEPFISEIARSLGMKRSSLERNLRKHVERLQSPPKPRKQHTVIFPSPSPKFTDYLSLTGDDYIFQPPQKTAIVRFFVACYVLMLIALSTYDKLD